MVSFSDFIYYKLKWLVLYHALHCLSLIHILRIRVLEASIANEYFSGVDDLTMPQSQFCALSLPVQKVFVVEEF